MEEKPKNRKKSSNILLILGILCLLGAGGFMLRNHLESQRAGQTSANILDNVQKEIEAAMASMDAAEPVTAAEGETGGENPADPTNGTLPPNQRRVRYPEYGAKMPTVQVDGQDYIGILQIPDLELVLPVLAVLNQETLESTPCLFDGRVNRDDMLIAAHNYATHFGNIKSLQPGAVLIFTDAAGRRYEYEMIFSEDMNRRENIRMYGGDWDLTIFTCVPNTTNRLAVRFRRTYPEFESRHLDKSNLQVPNIP